MHLSALAIYGPPLVWDSLLGSRGRCSFPVLPAKTDRREASAIETLPTGNADNAFGRQLTEAEPTFPERCGEARLDPMRNKDRVAVVRKLLPCYGAAMGILP